MIGGVVPSVAHARAIASRNTSMKVVRQSDADDLQALAARLRRMLTALLR